MPFYAGIVMMAGIGASALVVIVLVDAGWQAAQACRASFQYPAGDRDVSEFYGLRPGVLLTLYVERGLWERFLASRE